MKHEEKFKKIEEIGAQVLDIVQTLHDVVWEPQEGQEDHFDKLNKSEKVALIGILNDASHLNASINSYLHWFK